MWDGEKQKLAPVEVMGHELSTQSASLKVIKIVKSLKRLGTVTSELLVGKIAL